MTSGVSNSANQASASSAANTARTSALQQKDDFLKLLTYQLKSQNPLNPMDNQEFASQLAQFSQLEQMIDIRSILEEQVQSNVLLTQTISNSALPGLLGKQAKALSNQLHYDGENNVSIGYSLPYAAKDAQIRIKDEAGTIVRTIELSDSDLERGEKQLEWDGKNDEGDSLSAGNYSFEITASDRNGASYSPDTYTYGEIQAVRFKSEGTMIVVNGVEISLDSILDISTGN